MRFCVRDNRTAGMAPSEIKTALQDNALQLCPYRDLGHFEKDQILDGFLYRGTSVKDRRPRCMDILSLGYGIEGLPTALVQISTPDGAWLHAACLCTYCDHLGWCEDRPGGYFQEILEDDQIWNAKDLRDEEDEDGD